MDDDKQQDEANLTPAEVLAQQKAHLSFINSVSLPNQPKHDIRRVITIVIVVIIFAGALLGIYSAVFSHKASAKNTKSATAKVSANNTTSASLNANQSTQTYTSTPYNLSFNYPSNWSVINTTNGLLTITSPPTSLVSASGQTVTGEIIMTVQPQGQLPASFSAGTALAVLNSQLVSYANPTTSQSAQTYISYVQYSSTITKGGLDGVYLTGNSGYTQTQVIPASDIAAISPLITVTFDKCANIICSSSLLPLTVSSAQWIKSPGQALILKMFESFSFQ